MPASDLTKKSIAALETLRAEAARRGYTAIEPAILQPLEPFLDLSGEDIRARLLLATDPAGREFCLRPDFTIPVSLYHLASGDLSAPTRYSYAGPVFRHRSGGGEPDEFLQAGVESFGDDMPLARDAEIVGEGIETASRLGLMTPALRLGDPTLFLAAAEALEVPAPAMRRLRAGFGRAGGVARALTDDATESRQATGADQFADMPAEAVRALVSRMADMAGIAPVGGRTADEIAERIVERAQGADAAVLTTEARDVLTMISAIAGPPGEALDQIGAIARDAGIMLDDVLDTLADRTEMIQSTLRDVLPGQAPGLSFVASFGRQLDYYSGFVFEVTDGSDTTDASDVPLVGGGRYDQLLSALGASKPVAAVGYSVWVDRILSRGGAR
ncbi:MAG: ATP phosphoribosyltransferase regulatory subunit [Pseudomonadota bacterium]